MFSSDQKDEGERDVLEEVEECEEEEEEEEEDLEDLEDLEEEEDAWGDLTGSSGKGVVTDLRGGLPTRRAGAPVRSRGLTLTWSKGFVYGVSSLSSWEDSDWVFSGFEDDS